MPDPLPTPSTVQLRAVSRAFGSTLAVDAVSLRLDPGSFTALVGPSGCGKTTLLRMIGGLERPDRGAIERGAAAAGFCFQEPRLLGWRSVAENVALPLELAGVPVAERRARAEETLRLVQLGDAKDRLPHELSGGMKMRAALARVLVGAPGLLLLDEPFGALDEVTRHELDEALRRLWEQARFTAVLVTHSLPEAVYLADRVVVFSPRPARALAEFQTPTGARDPGSWTSAAQNDVVRRAAETLQRGIAEARR